MAVISIRSGLTCDGMDVRASFLCLLCTAERFDGFDDLSLVRDGDIFQRATIRHRNIFAGHTLNGSVEIVERRRVHALGNLRAQAAKTPALFNNNEAPGFLD